MTINQYTVGIDVDSVNAHSSTGYIFNSSCNIKTLVLTAKHSICDIKTACKKIKRDVNSCRLCQPNIESRNIIIKHKDAELFIESMHASKRADVALVEVASIADIPKLYITDMDSDDCVVYSSQGINRWLLNNLDVSCDGLGKYNVMSNVNANLDTKSSEFSGFSGGVVFKKIDKNYYANAIVTEDGGGNDVGVELIDKSLLDEFEEYTGTKNFQFQSKFLFKQFIEEKHIECRSCGKGALFKLLEKSKEMTKSDPDYKYMIDELKELLSPKPGREIVGLENKLKDGCREDLYVDAEFLSNKFARRVSNGQFSMADELIFYHCLSIINSVFRQKISPHIKSGSDNILIDRMIYDEIVKALNEEVSEFTVSINTGMIQGMLYFLTGMCHLRWSK